jgi:hypothetical protein
MLHKTILVLTKKKSMFYVLMFEFMLLGVIGGLLGIFYPLYSKVFVPMVKSGNRFLHFIAYPLGFCIYCSTFWITMLILILFLTSWDSLPKWQDIVIGIIAAEGVAHLIVCISCRFLIHKHPDLDKDYLKHLHE